ncbi:ASPIC/UnbV domain-containing protein [candidate division KSB1 bacterium]|nr:ASPIC/UnbV domain-containing protein [candidate division KSB1 bacterium]
MIRYKRLCFSILFSINMLCGSGSFNDCTAGSVTLIENPRQSGIQLHYMIIAAAPAHQDSSLRLLADFRAEHDGFDIGILSDSTIYSEFPDRNAASSIRQCLIYVYENWDLPYIENYPFFYLLLVGDATAGDVFSLPIHHDAAYPDRASDFYFACLNDDNGDGLVDEDDKVPDIALGRFSVGDRFELQAMVHKTIAHENGIQSAAERAIHFFNGFKTSGERNKVRSVYSEMQTQFESQSEYRLAAYYDDNIVTTQEFRDSLLTCLRFKNSDILIYHGHGGHTVWSDGFGFNYLSSEDARNLLSKNPSVILAFSCSTLKIDSTVDCLGEALVNTPDGGKCAYWGSPAIESVQNGAKFNLFMTKYIAKGSQTLGGILFLTLRDLSLNVYPFPNYLLLGDPALRLRQHGYSIIPRINSAVSFVKRYRENYPDTVKVTIFNQSLLPSGEFTITVFQNDAAGKLAMFDAPQTISFFEAESMHTVHFLGDAIYQNGDFLPTIRITSDAPFVGDSLFSVQITPAPLVDAAISELGFEINEQLSEEPDSIVFELSNFGPDSIADYTIYILNKTRDYVNSFPSSGIDYHSRYWDNPVLQGYSSRRMKLPNPEIRLAFENTIVVSVGIRGDEKDVNEKNNRDSCLTAPYFKDTFRFTRKDDFLEDIGLSFIDNQWICVDLKFNDLNNDLRDDLIICFYDTTSNMSHLRVLKNCGESGYEDYTSRLGLDASLTKFGAPWLLVLDLNHDKYLDFIYANSVGGYVAFINHEFTRFIQYPCRTPAGSNWIFRYPLIVADLDDKPSDLELLSIHHSDGKNEVQIVKYLEDGIFYSDTSHATFADSALYQFFSQTRAWYYGDFILFFDYNMDAKPDIIKFENSAKPYLLKGIYKNQHGQFIEDTTWTEKDFYFFEFWDIDFDGAVEIIGARDYVDYSEERLMRKKYTHAPKLSGQSPKYLLCDFDNSTVCDFLYRNQTFGTGITFELAQSHQPTYALCDRELEWVTLADYDHDGDTDIFFPQSYLYYPFGGANSFNLLRAHYANNWLDIELSGVESNAFGLGARVIIYFGGRCFGRMQQNYFLSPTGFDRISNFGDFRALHFGLGTSNRVDSVIVFWTSGHIDRLRDVPINQRIEITEGIGITATPGMDIEAFQLLGNYPNPFNSTTIIRLKLPHAACTGVGTLKIYDVLGREVCSTRFNIPGCAGYHNIVWNGQDNSSRLVSSGVYFYEIRIENLRRVGKMLLVR